MTGVKTTIRIETHDRWDALDLTRHLPAREWYLVAYAPQRWDVFVRTEHRRRRLNELLDAAQAWASRRNTETVVHLPDRDVVLRPAPE